MRITILLAVSALGLVVAPLQPQDELVFRPAQGRALSFAFHETTELELVSSQQSLDGELQDPVGHRVDVLNNRAVSFSDEILEVDGAWIPKLARSFTTITARSETSVAAGEFKLGPWVAEGSSELEGARVILDRDQESGECVARYDEESEEHDEEHLAGLDGTVGFTGLLPASAVSEGDTWKVGPEALVAIFMPGGELSTGLDPPQGKANGPAIAFSYFLSLAECGRELEGKVVLEHAGREESEEGDLVRIHIVASFTSTRDVLEPMTAIATGMNAQVSSDTMGVLEEAIFEYSFEGEGELVWDIDAGCPRSLDLSGELKIACPVTYDTKNGELLLESIFAGTTSISVEVER